MGQTRLDRLPKRQRSRSYVAPEEIHEYVTLSECQIGEIRKGLIEADRGEFATPQRMRRTIAKWTRSR